MTHFVRPLAPSLPKLRPVLSPSMDPARYLKDALPSSNVAGYLQRGLPGANTYAQVLKRPPLGRPPQLGGS